MTRALTQTINGFVTGRLNDPGFGKFRYAVLLPLCDGGGKGFLRGFFGEIEIADELDRCRDDAAPVGTIERGNSKNALTARIIKRRVGSQAKIKRSRVGHRIFWGIILEL